MNIQVLIIMVGGVILLASTVRLVRLGLLSIRYGLGWLALATLAILGAPVFSVVSKAVSGHGFTSTGFAVAVLLLFLGLVCLQLSVSVSGLHHAVQELSEYSALLEQRVSAVEAKGATDD